MSPAEPGSHTDTFGAGAVGGIVGTGWLIYTFHNSRKVSLCLFLGTNEETEAGKVKPLFQGHGNKERRFWNLESPQPMLYTSVCIASRSHHSQDSVFLCLPLSILQTQPLTHSHAGVSAPPRFPASPRPPVTDNMGEKGCPPPFRK